MGLVSPDGRRASQPLPSIAMNGLPFARVLDGVTALVCLDRWIRPIVIGRGHEAYCAAKVLPAWKWKPVGRVDSYDTGVAQK